MRRYLSLPVFIVLALIGAALAGSYLLEDSGPAGVRRQAAAAAVIPVDEKTFLTARRLAQVADSTEEQTLAHEAIRLAGRELDQAFAGSIREANVKKPPATGPLKDLIERIATGKAKVEADQQELSKLTKPANPSDDIAGQIDLAKAQMTLDQDELEDAKSDLAQAGGDQKSVLDRALEEYQALQHAAVTMRAISGSPPPSLLGQISWWLGLSSRASDIDSARTQATAKASRLAHEHGTLEALSHQKAVPQDGAASDDGEDGAA